jgi:L-gulonate 5-dehydrogenase
MRVVSVPDVDPPEHAEVLLRPEAVGICGSDLHYFSGDIAGIEAADRYPRILGHEASGVIESLGPDCPPHLEVGARVALFPMRPCGSCHPCRTGRPNVCELFTIIGVHIDGALQERYKAPAEWVFPVGDLEPRVAALIEPMSIGVHALARARVLEGEKILVLGAGPIGYGLALAAIDLGASVLLVDRIESRLRRAEQLGADTYLAADDEAVRSRSSAWSGGAGPDVVIEATGVPELVPLALDLVRPTGRVVIVGLSSRETPVRVGDLVFKETDLLGSCACSPASFQAAVDLVRRRPQEVAGMISHDVGFDEAPAATTMALEQPGDVLKVVVDMRG